MESPALVVFQPRENPHVRLFCFPHAGGGPHAFRDWGLVLPETVEVQVLSYAGRGARHAEPFAQDAIGGQVDVDASIREAFAAIRGQGDRPAALFGNSFGAVLAFEVARRLDAAGSAPLHVFASSCAAPHLDAQCDRLSDLADAALVTELTRRGWLADAATAAPSVLAAALPALRTRRSAYEFVSGPEARRFPLTVLGGADDASIGRDTLAAWALSLRPPPPPRGAACGGDAADGCSVPTDADDFAVALCPGAGHFHVDSHHHFAIDVVARALGTSLRRRAPPSVAIGATRRADFDAQFGGRMQHSIIDVLHRYAADAETRDSVCIRDVGADPETEAREETDLTFAQLGAAFFAKARKLAGALRRAPFSVGPEAVVAVVYFEVNYTTTLIADLLEASRARAVVTDAVLARNLPAGAPRIVLKRGWDTSPDWDLYAACPLLPAAAAGSLAFCSMSSGTTGRPKAILVPHSSVCPYDADPAVDREGCNIFFVWESLRALVHGRACVVIPDAVVLDAARLVRFLRDEKVTRSLLRNVLDQPGLRDLPRYLRGMRYVLLEGEVVPTKLVGDFAARFDGAADAPDLVNYYSTWEYPRRGVHAALLAPRRRVVLLVLDRRTTTPVPRGVPGAVFVVAESIGRGYLGDAAKTTLRFVPNLLRAIAAADGDVAALLRAADARGWALAVNKGYDTGDRGVLLRDGRLLLLGRADATVKIRGFKVALNYVEATLLQAPGVASAVVRPIFDASTSQPEGLAAYVVARDDAVWRAAGAAVEFTWRVRDFVAAALPEYAVPSHFIALQGLPTRPGSGKLDFSKLPQPSEANRTASARPHSKTASADAAASVDVDAGRRVGDGDAASGADQVASASTDATAVDSAAVLASAAPHRDFVRVAARAISAAFEWALRLPAGSVSRSANFFDLGGHSLHAAQIVGRGLRAVSSSLGVELAVVDLFERPSVDAITALLVQRRERASRRHRPAPVRPPVIRGAPEALSLAVTGMAALLPGASDVAQFWRNLAAGHDSLASASVAELRARGVPSTLLEDAAFVPKVQRIAGSAVTEFDAAFWGISRSEARVMDPQHRKLMEVAWHCVEAAGRGPRAQTTTFGDDTGVFASSGIDGYLVHHLRGAPLLDAGDPAAIFRGEVGSEKDYAPTRISRAVTPAVATESRATVQGVVLPRQADRFAFGLRGPSVAINSACSSGLVATAMAANSIRAGGCRNALVGAASITFPNLGYKYVEGLVSSIDGVVRPLDAAAYGTAASVPDVAYQCWSGTVFGDGVGAVLLEGFSADAPLDASRPLLAVLVSSCVSNDGSLKAGFTAPSADAQSRAIVASMLQANVSGAGLDYVELHATATMLGDAIEVAGLARALARLRPPSGGEDATPRPTLLGSVKGNIGHANCAAGLTGLLKAVLVLSGNPDRRSHDGGQSRTLNPKIMLPSHCAVVCDALAALLAGSGAAQSHVVGVSSFGVGGTNAHATLRCAAAARSGVAALRDAYYGAAAAVHVAAERAIPRAVPRPQKAAAAQSQLLSAQSQQRLESFASDLDSAAAAAVQTGLLSAADAGRPASAALVPMLQQLQRRTAATAGDKVGAAAPAAGEPRRRGDATEPRRVDSVDSNLAFATNKHAATGGAPASAVPGRAEVIVLSAKSEGALDGARLALIAYLETLRDAPLRAGAGDGAKAGDVATLADVAFTLQEGHAVWREWRLAFAAVSVDDAVAQLKAADKVKGAERGEVCLVLGGGGDFEDDVGATNASVRAVRGGGALLPAGAGSGLYETHAGFRRRLQTCAAILDDVLKQVAGPGGQGGLLDVLGFEASRREASTFAAHGRSSEVSLRRHLASPAMSQPAEAALLYALAACLGGDVLDLQFAAVAGRGVGQIVALVLDGAMALDDALLFIAERGRAADALDAPAGAAEVEALMAARLAERPRRLRAVAGAPVCDNVSGGWLGAVDVTDAAYWRLHAEREPAWRENLRALRQWEPTLLVCVDAAGGGVASCGGGGTAAPDGPPPSALKRACCTLTGDARADACVIQGALAAAWLAGVDVDWAAARASAGGAEFPPRFLPGAPRYAFARTVHWANANASCYAPVAAVAAPRGWGSAVPSGAAPAKAADGARSLPASTTVLVRKSSSATHGLRARLVIAPYAGGSSAALQGWGRAAPPWLDVLVLELPSRGGRADEAAPDDDADDVLELAKFSGAVEAVCADGLPWFLVGLSFGALLALELVAALDGQTLKALRRVILAGRCPPHADFCEADAAPRPVPSDAEILDIYTLDDRRDSEIFRSVALPRLRGDLAADARAERRVAGLVRCWPAGFVATPVCVVGGLNDASFPLRRAGHDFLVNGFREILADIVSHLADVAAAAPAEPVPAPSFDDPPHNDSALHTVRWEPAVGSTARPMPEACAVLRLASLRSDGEAAAVAAALVKAGAASVVFDGMATDDCGEDWLSAAARGSVENSDRRRRTKRARGRCSRWCVLVRAPFTARDVVLVSRASARGALAAGASRCVCFELPECNVRRCFVHVARGHVEAIAPTARDALAIWAAAQSDENDFLVVPTGPAAPPAVAAPWASWRVDVPRARRCAARAAAAPAVLDCVGALGAGDEKVVVTGATGGLGSALVAWLLLQGVSAGALVFVGRSPPEGMEVRLHGAAFCRVEDLSSLAELRRGLEGVARVRVVFHLAGALADSTVLNLTRAGFAAVVGPKAGAAVALRRLALERDWRARAIVAYSSTTSLFGFPGQANYAAANAVLDHLADWGCDDEAGPALLTLHWGPWADAGMAREGTRAYAAAVAYGDAPLSTAEGLAALAAALGAAPRGGVRFAAFRVADWRKSPWRALAATAHLRRDDAQPAGGAAAAAAAPAGAAGASGGASDADCGADCGARGDAVEAFLRRRVSEWLPASSLESLGLDSLDLAQLRGDFAAAFKFRAPPPLAWFSKPDVTLADLAAALRGHVGPPDAAPERRDVEPRIHRAAPDDAEDSDGSSAVE
ncbi:hypothetical protein M885DRAFT_571480 [Pelagophyceae sp. CCMP2097]|nr:hypothetical protein M885DRAFT_571480 [Pelagophyceae sp. CCMP2097]